MKGVKIGNNVYPLLRDTTLIGSWEEVQGIKASTLNQRLPNEDLDGLIIRGYEMEWDKVNENGEKYDREAFGDFIKSYFVEKGMNLIVDINHEGFCNYHTEAGRVLYVEINTRGFYFVVYINREYPYYEELKWRLKEGLLQGFSKEGYVTEYECKYTEDGEFDHVLIKKIKLLHMSLVSMPANGVPFEKVQETTKNGLVYVDNIESEEKPASVLQRLFNK